MKRAEALAAVEEARASTVLSDAVSKLAAVYPVVDRGTKEQILGMLEKWIAYERRELKRKDKR